MKNKDDRNLCLSCGKRKDCMVVKYNQSHIKIVSCKNYQKDEQVIEIDTARKRPVDKNMF